MPCFRRRFSFSLRALAVLGGLIFQAAAALAQATSSNPGQASSSSTATPLLSPQQAAAQGSNPPLTHAALAPAGAASKPANARPDTQRRPARAAAPLPAPGEFELFATQLNAEVPVRRFGLQMRREDGAAAQLETPQRVPPEYLLRAGDELLIALWGGVDADWRVRIDRAGRAVLPRVGPVPLAGVPAGELEARLKPRLDRVFRNYELSASVAELSAIQVHVTGFVEQPGSYVVPGLTTLSTLLSTVQGPAASGSFRQIQLLRDDKLLTELDLYRLLADGRRADDTLLQAGDVVHIGPVAAQVAVLGSVNRSAVFEIRPGDTVADVLRLAGGFSSVADRRRVAIERLAQRDGSGVVQLELPADAGRVLADGDVLRVFSSVDATRPTQLRNKRIRIEGEVLRPGDYVMPPGATLADALAAAGGTTPAAYLFGTEFRRESVRQEQEINYERALQEMEAEVARQKDATLDRNAEADNAAARRLIERLRARRPDGRVVLDLQPQSAALPALPLEDGDRLSLPPRKRAVGVFGSVYNGGSFVHDEGRKLGDYLGRAGGPTAGADADGVFVVRANGSVVSARQGGRWRGLALFEDQAALPGDTLFVPEDLHRVSIVQGAKDWTQILYQFGLGIAGLLTLR